MKKVIGYVGTKALGEMREEDIRCLDIINIAFAQVQDACVVWNTKVSREALKRIRTVHPEIKILLSIGGWGADGFSQAARTEQGRSRMAESASSRVAEFGLDGIDIDWEYPGSSLAGIASCPEDKENFTLLMKAIRERLTMLGAGKMLTIAAGGDTYFTVQTNLREASEYLDYVQLMTYDLQGGFQKVTGHHSALYPSMGNLLDVCVDKAVRVFQEAGVPAEKLIVGVPFYSRQWSGVKGEKSGLGLEAETVGGYGPNYGRLLEEYLDKNGYHRTWDEEAKVPSLFNGDTFISYEDQQSMAAKIAYIKEKGLAGIMFWEYNSDTTGTLVPFLRQEMDK